jgi:hypothetical protein
MTKPTRLTESGGPAVRAAIEEAQAALGSPEDVARLRAKLGTLPAAVSTAPRARSSHVAVKIIGMGVLVGVGLMLALPRPAQAPKVQPVVNVQAVPVAPRASPAVVVLEAHAVIPPTSVPAPVVPRKRSASHIEPAPLAPVSAPTGNTNDELKLLMSAQDAVEASPRRALALLEQHAQQFPNGNFVQERESLAIDALRKLSLVSQARVRAQAFLAKFPTSPHARRIELWLKEIEAVDHKETVEPLPTH